MLVDGSPPRTLSLEQVCPPTPIAAKALEQTRRFLTEEYPAVLASQIKRRQAIKTPVEFYRNADLGRAIGLIRLLVFRKPCPEHLFDEYTRRQSSWAVAVVKSALGVQRGSSRRLSEEDLTQLEQANRLPI